MRASILSQCQMINRNWLLPDRHDAPYVSTMQDLRGVRDEQDACLPRVRCEVGVRWGARGCDAAAGCMAWGAVALGCVESRLMGALAAAAGHVVPCERLADALYGDDIDGGPDDARGGQSMSGSCILRRRLTKAGFPGAIRTSHGVGYELALAA